MVAATLEEKLGYYALTTLSSITNANPFIRNNNKGWRVAAVARGFNHVEYSIYIHYIVVPGEEDAHRTR